MTHRIAQGRRFRTGGLLAPRHTPHHALIDAPRVRTAAQQLTKDTTWVNRVLSEMNHNTYHDGIPLARVNMALHAHGFDELEEMILCGAQGSINEPVGRNRYLSLTWYKMESGRYEVVAYVS